jgi:phytoene dehydrogenase-like protein
MALVGGLPVSVLAKRFATDEGKALIAGVSAHAIAPFHAPATAAVGVMLGAIAHTHGWPMAKGGSQTITAALAARFLELGGEIEVGRMVRSVDELPAGMVFLDVMPPAAYDIARDRVSRVNARGLSHWRPGPGIFKIDWALDGPIPWLDDFSPRAGTVHVGGTYEEVAEAEDAVHAGRHPARPFVLIAQQSLFDPSRAPEGAHTVWGYCHVPAGSDVDMTDAIEAQVERFAPGFRDLILARHTMTTEALEAHNPNYIGGDIAGGGFGLRKVFQLGSNRPYRFGDGLYLCSSATPPGAGVHGMCGYYAAKAALGGSEF